MTDSPLIDLYCLCWNDARLLPHFFQHYDDLVDRYFVFDTGSTDESLALLQDHPKVTLGHIDLLHQSYADAKRRLSDTLWKRSRGAADWIVVVDIAELLFRPDFKAYLAACTAAGVTAVRSVGYEMVSEAFPEPGAMLAHSITRGVRTEDYDKLCVFNPDALTDLYFAAGRREAAPTGRVVYPETPEVLLLHYEQLGVDYAVRRSAERHLGLPVDDGAALEQWSAEAIVQHFETLNRDAAAVPGLETLQVTEAAASAGAPTPALLGNLPLAAFPSYEELKAAIQQDPFSDDRDSTLVTLIRVFLRAVPVDEAHYRREYPDVAEAVDAGTIESATQHYVEFGYFEGRSPAPGVKP